MSLMNSLRTLRDRVHPLNNLRKHTSARTILDALDIRVWVRAKHISFPIRARLIRHASNFLLNKGVEPGVTALFLSVASEIEVRSFWDVGANFGYYAWLVRSALPDCEIRLFEPDSDNARLIRDTIARSRLKRVALRPIALSDSAGTAEFLPDPHTGSTGQISTPMSATFAQRQWAIASNPVTVETGTLSGEWSAGAVPNLIKVDVEGHEEAVFRGGRAAVLKDQPLLIYECYHAESEIHSMLHSAGYRLFDADSAGSITATTCNFFALPRRYERAAAALLKRWRALIP